MLVSSAPLSLTIDNGLPRQAMMASSSRPTSDGDDRCQRFQGDMTTVPRDIHTCNQPRARKLRKAAQTGRILLMRVAGRHFETPQSKL